MLTLRKMKLSDAEDYLTCQDKEAKKNFISVPKTAAEAAPKAATEISPGNIEVSASVTVEYLI